MIIQKNNSKLSKMLDRYIKDNNINNIILLPINNDIYRIKEVYPNETRYLFFTSSLDNSLLHFIQEYCGELEIFLYHDSIMCPIPSSSMEKCTNLVDYKIELKLLTPSTISVPYIVDMMYVGDPNIIKQPKFICFLNNDQQIPDSVRFLLDQTNMNLLITDCYEPHKYNLGPTTEDEKYKLLCDCTFYVDITENYAEEAKRCGCRILRLDNNTFKEVVITQDTIDIQQFIQNILKVQI